MTSFDRRRFLKTGVAMTACVLPRSGISPIPTQNFLTQPITAVFDPRIADSRDFALGAQLTGATVQSLHDDSGLLWYPLLHTNASRKLAIMGLTRESDFFLVARLAADARMSIRYRGQHDYIGVAVEHTISIPAISKEFAFDVPAWAMDLGAIVALSDFSMCAQCGLSAYSSHATRAHMHLVSWFVA